MLHIFRKRIDKHCWSEICFILFAVKVRQSSIVCYWFIFFDSVIEARECEWVVSLSLNMETKLLKNSENRLELTLIQTVHVNNGIYQQIYTGKELENFCWIAFCCYGGNTENILWYYSCKYYSSIHTFRNYWWRNWCQNYFIMEYFVWRWNFWAKARLLVIGWAQNVVVLLIRSIIDEDFEFPLNFGMLGCPECSRCIITNNRQFMKFQSTSYGMKIIILNFCTL